MQLAKLEKHNLKHKSEIYNILNKNVEFFASQTHKSKKFNIYQKNMTSCANQKSDYNEISLMKIELKSLAIELKAKVFVLTASQNIIVERDESIKLQKNEQIVLFSKDKIKTSQPKREFEFTDCRNVNKPKILSNRFICAEDLILGEGFTGKIVKGFGVVAPYSPFALKFVRKSDKIESKYATNEIQALKSIDHQNIIKLYDNFIVNDATVLVLELMDKDLTDYVTEKKLKRIDEEETKCIIRQVLSGIQYLHSNFIAHNDLKNDNILVGTTTKGPIFKICDFGSSTSNKTVWNYNPRTECNFEYTPYYVAPEVLNAISGNITTFSKTQSDMWSLGVICFSIISGKFPFSADTDDQGRLNAIYKFPGYLRNKISRNFMDFVRNLLVVNAENRMSASDAIQHIWFTKTSQTWTIDTTLKNHERQSMIHHSTTKKLLSRFSVRRSARILQRNTQYASRMTTLNKM